MEGREKEELATLQLRLDSKIKVSAIGKYKIESNDGFIDHLTGD